MNTVTKFVSTEIDVGKDMSFFVDGNSKITADDGDFDDPKPNAFSLPHISTCPGSTEECRKECYVHGLQEYSKDTYAKYMQNERVLHAVLMSSKIAWRAAKTLGGYIHDNCSRFRWHVSGDVFNLRYASWITEVCALSPDTKHWIYTRTFQAVSTLVAAGNLEVNISADAGNWENALATAEYYGLRLCYLTIDGTFPDELLGREKASVIFPDYQLRGRKLDDQLQAPWWQGLDNDAKKLVCAADFFGQSPSIRCGPCKKCFKDA